MIDFIFFVFFLVTFAAGFWCGKRYGNVKAMFAAWAQVFQGWLS